MCINIIVVLSTDIVVVRFLQYILFLLWPVAPVAQLVTS